MRGTAPEHTLQGLCCGRNTRGKKRRGGPSPPKAAGAPPKRAQPQALLLVKENPLVPKCKYRKTQSDYLGIVKFRKVLDFFFFFSRACDRTLARYGGLSRHGVAWRSESCVVNDTHTRACRAPPACAAPRRDHRAREKQRGAYTYPCPPFCAARVRLRCWASNVETFYWVEARCSRQLGCDIYGGGSGLRTCHSLLSCFGSDVVDFPSLGRDVKIDCVDERSGRKKNFFKLCSFQSQYNQEREM